MSALPFENVPVSTSAFKADPYPFYSRLRAERPVCRVPLMRGQDVVIVTRYDDVSELLKDQRFAKDPANALTAAQLAKLRKPPKFLSPLTRNMLALDDPDHARLKRLVQAAFTPRRIAELETRVQAASNELLDRLSNRKRFDLITDYALPLPVAVVSDLLGIPKADQTRFARWSHAIIRVGSASLGVLLLLPQILAFLRYLKKLIAMKRADPGDDLVSALVQNEAAGDHLDGEELMAMIAILLSAGHETTTNLIGNGMLELMRNPAERERLVAAPKLIEAAIEELLRFASPVEMSTQRYAREAVEIASVTIPQGAMVMGVIASANRDERQFQNPDRLDVGRAKVRHLTFGEGGHYCLGAALARLEGRIAITDILSRMPNLSLAITDEKLRWRPGMVLRGLESLPCQQLLS